MIRKYSLNKNKLTKKEKKKKKTGHKNGRKNYSQT